MSSEKEVWSLFFFLISPQNCLITHQQEMVGRKSNEINQVERESELVLIKQLAAWN